MAKFDYVYDNEQNIKSKPRLYFTCHHLDFDDYFEWVTEDVLEAFDCIIYYTEDMTEELTEENLSVDINRMNLVVVPITKKLLVEPNRAMDVDIPYAIKNGIPVLPLMMEDGIVDIYSQPDKFGEMQFIKPVGLESYYKKLSDFLVFRLTSGEVAKRVRLEFGAYIFLSYRKKDRVYANELMKLIHANPKYQDIAIWYDEFLLPGESFRDNISRALTDSRFVLLLVTPSLLEDGNFVMTDEYPAARENGKAILPIEMAPTDRDELSRRFDGIPTPISVCDSGAIYAMLDSMLANTAIEEDDDDPEHNYLIGLAYLRGIDVEVDREKSMELIKKAAEAGHIDAMLWLVTVFPDGEDDRSGIEWGWRAYRLCLSSFGAEDEKTLRALDVLVGRHRDMSINDALMLAKRAYALHLKLHGEEHPDSIDAMHTVVEIYENANKHENALAFLEQEYKTRCKMHGEEHPGSVSVLHMIAQMHENAGECENALAFYEQVYKVKCKTHGEYHTDTIYAYRQLINCEIRIDPKKAFDMAKRLYHSCVAEFGEKSLESDLALDILHRVCDAVDIAHCWGEAKTGEVKLLSDGLNEKTEHDASPMRNSISCYDEKGENDNSVQACEREYILSCERLGEDDPHSISMLDNLCNCYFGAEEIDKAIMLRKRHVEICTKVYGEDGEETLKSMEILADYYKKGGYATTAVVLLEKIYGLSSISLGRGSLVTVAALRKVADAYLCLGDKERALELYHELLNLILCFHEDEYEVIKNLFDIIENLETEV